MRKQKEKGITLIALVVTIIVLLILAGVSIAMLTGEGGILKQAGEARERTGRANIIEQARVDLLEKQTETKRKVTKEDLYEVLNKYFENVPTLENEIWNDEETWKKEEVTGKNDKTVKVKIGEIYGGTLENEEKIESCEYYYLWNSYDWPGQEMYINLIYDKIKEKYIQKLIQELPDTEEELFLEVYNEYRKSRELEELGTFEEMVEELKKEEVLEGEYNTAKELYMADRGYENYNQFIEELQSQYPEIKTEEELLLKSFNEYRKSQELEEFETFEEMVEELKKEEGLEGEFKTANELYMARFENSYNQYIEGLREEFYNKPLEELKNNENNIEVYNPDGDYGLYSIQGPGKYTYTVKMPNGEQYQFNVVIDTIEIVTHSNEAYVYDFSSGRCLTIDSGKWTNEKENMNNENIPDKNILFDSAENYHYVDLFDGITKMELICDDSIVVDGYSFFEIPV